MKFEGIEKTLDIGFNSRVPGLRKRDGFWESVMNACGAGIISRMSNDYLDAYILSESSLLVWDDHIQVSTCGTTNLLNAVEPIFNLVPKDRTNFFFYGRKNLQFPDDQESDFNIDVARAAAYFPGASGCLGAADSDHFHYFCWRSTDALSENESYIKVMMTDLDPAVGNLFCRENVENTSDAERRSGLTALFSKGVRIDNCLFSPVGYSANGIRKDRYLTVHITPQRACSYASFETTFTDIPYIDLILKSVSIFKPAAFSTVTIASTDAPPRPGAFTVPRYKNSMQTVFVDALGCYITFMSFLYATSPTEAGNPPALAVEP